jgi:hypothetical protein
MSIHMKCIYLFCIVLFLASCDIFTGEDDSAIRNLSFTRSDRFQEPYNAYAVGYPLILSAISFPSEFNKPARINVFSSSGQFTRVTLNTLHKIPGVQLAAIIEDHDGSAIITVKEADRKHAMDRDTFLYTTSPQTLQKVWDWIDEMEGVEVVSQIINSPVLVLQMTPTAEIVDAIRGSDNVEILEPNSRAFLLGGSKSNSLHTADMVYKSAQASQTRTEDPISVMGVIFTSTDESSRQFFVQPGDTITAKYNHPDGRVLTARTTIR